MMFLNDDVSCTPGYIYRINGVKVTGNLNAVHIVDGRPSIIIIYNYRESTINLLNINFADCMW